MGLNLKAEREKFIRMFMDGVETGYIRVATRDKNGSFSDNFVKAGPAEEVLEEVEKLDDLSATNVFVAPVLYSTPSAKKVNVTIIPWLVLDFDDFKGTPLKELSKVKRQEGHQEIVHILTESDLTPSLIINSGHGIHVYWKLEEPVGATEGVLVEQIQKAMAGHFTPLKGDTAAATLGHMLRLPGTYNLKDDDNKKECHIVSTSDKKYTLETIKDVLQIQAIKPQTKRKSQNSMTTTYDELICSEVDVANALAKCQFTKRMFSKPELQTYKLWECLAMTLAVFGGEGEKLFHLISSKHPDYDEQEASDIFRSLEEKLVADGYFPPNCRTLEEHGFPCSEVCKQKSPAGKILAKLMITQKKRLLPLEETRKGIDQLTRTGDSVKDVRALEKWIKEKLSVSEGSPEEKVIVLKEAMKHLKVAEKTHLTNLKKKISVVSDTNFFVKQAKKIMDHTHILFDERFYIFKKGVWVIYEGVEKQIIENLGSAYCKKSVGEVKFYLETVTWLPKEEKTKGKDLVNLKNGMLNVAGEPVLLPHKPSYYRFLQLPFEYAPDEGCPAFEAFLEESLGHLSDEEARGTIQLLQEWFGYCLIEGNDLQKMLVVIGKSRTGKGVLLEVLRSLLGPENVSSVPLGKIDKEFNVIHLKNKLANISPEPNENEKLNVAHIKSLVGKDSVSGRMLFENLEGFVNKAKLVLGANHPIRMRDSSRAADERLLYVNMDNYVEPHKRDPELVVKLKKELPGILNWAIQGRQQLLNRGYFQETPGMLAMKSEYHKMDNEVYDWFQEVKEALGGKREIKVKEAFDKYRIFCGEVNVTPKSRREFLHAVQLLEGLKVGKCTKKKQDYIYIDWERVEASEAIKATPQHLKIVPYEPVIEIAKREGEQESTPGRAINRRTRTVRDKVDEYTAEPHTETISQSKEEEESAHTSDRFIDRRKASNEKADVTEMSRKEANSQSETLQEEPARKSDRTIDQSKADKKPAQPMEEVKEVMKKPSKKQKKENLPQNHEKAGQTHKIKTLLDEKVKIEHNV